MPSECVSVSLPGSPDSAGCGGRTSGDLSRTVCGHCPRNPWAAQLQPARPPGREGDRPLWSSALVQVFIVPLHTVGLWGRRDHGSPISGGGAPLYRGRGTPGHAQDVTAWVWGHSADSGSLGGEGTESAGLVRVRASKCGWRTCWKGLPGTATTSKNPDREPAAAGARAAQPWHLWHSPPSEGSRPRGGQSLAAPV